MPKKIYLTGLGSNKRQQTGGGLTFSCFSSEIQDKMLIENILGGDWCICPLSFVPYKGCLKSLFTFYGGNEHQIGHPGKPKLFVSSRKNVSFDSQKIFPFMGKSKFYNFSNGPCLWQLVLENNRMLHRGLKWYTFNSSEVEKFSETCFHILNLCIQMYN